MNPIIKSITDIFEKRGKDQYGVEEVNQLQHALQCGLLAQDAKAKNQQIVAALLHDIGHIYEGSHLSENLNGNFDDKHELRGNGWLKLHFGPEVADPIRLHVSAKRYLCTVDKTYESRLSPTSYKSYLDQGGPMSEEERADFEKEPYYKEALELRKWDDQAKDPNLQTPDLSHFILYLSNSIKQ